MSNRARLLALILACVLTLPGCTRLSFISSPPQNAAVLPTPPAGDEGEAPLSDGIASQMQTVTLYYIGTDRQRLVPVTRGFVLKSGDNLLEEVMERLLSAPGRDDAQSIAPIGTRLLSLELVSGIATVNLSQDARGLSSQQLVWMRQAIANTLTRLPSVRYVNVLIGGQVESLLGDLAMPGGVLTLGDDNLTTTWAQVQADAERFRPASNPRQLDATAVLYYASNQGDWVLPEARAVRFTSDEFVMPLLRELGRGPDALPEAESVLPADVEPLESAPAIQALADGRRLIELNFTETFHEDMQNRSMPLWRLYAALTLTLSQFVPEIDGITVKVGGQQVTGIDSPSGALFFRDGVMAPSAFTGFVGDVARVYLRGADDRLAMVSRVMDPQSRYQPRALLEMLFAGPRDGEGGVYGVMPAGVSGVDVLGVRVEGDQVLVNLSSNFYRCCQHLSVIDERCLIYAIVNTLTELDGIKKVRFYVEGSAVDTLAQAIYLREPLVRNPGIIAQ